MVSSMETDRKRMLGISSGGIPLKRRPDAFRRRQRKGILFVLPSVLLVVVFFLAPLGLMAWMSLNNWPLLGNIKFIGVSNYRALLNDHSFLSSLVFTLKYALIVTPLLLLVGFGLAALVTADRRGVRLFRAVYFMPLAIGYAAASYLWVWLLNPQVGIINRIIHDVCGVSKPIEWLATPGLSLFAVIVAVVWKTVGFSMLLLVGGLQGIPLDIIEAAEVDGAGRFRKFWFISLPLLRKTIALVLVFATVGAFLAFDQFYILTHGGPGISTMTVVYWIFNTSFYNFQLGFGSAASVVLLVILVLLAALEMRLLNDETRY
jgi:multiple sugar transport system permease protein